jgi:voltage-gated potassium channel
MLVELGGRFVGISETTIGVITIVNAILTVFFLFDFFYRLFTASSMPRYFWGHQGWADLLACAPQLRIFRLFRVVRAIRLLRRFGVRNMLNQILNNRASSALYITVFLIIVVAETAATTILLAESTNPDANLTTAGDAVWWVFVTLTTVGYGDFFPYRNGTDHRRICHVLGHRADRRARQLPCQLLPGFAREAGKGAARRG